MASGVVWTQFQINVLTDLWAEGLTGTEIGLRLNKSKNSVIGKAARLGLARRKHIIKGFHKKTLMDLGESDCRYPLGDRKEPAFRYCGRKIKPGSSYCPKHHKKCFIPNSRSNQYARTSGL